MYATAKGNHLNLPSDTAMRSMIDYVHATVLGLSAVSTIASLHLRGAGVVIDLHWKMSKRKGADGGE